MRHNVKGRKLGRTASHRAATLRNLATSLIKHKKIKTTVAKAKELRSFIEPMITRAKTNSVHARRIVSDDIKEREMVTELFGNIVEKIGDRPGGYTRIVRLGQRKGDAAEMAIIELVDFSGIVKPKAPKKADKENQPEDAKVIEETKVEAKAEKKAVKAKKPAVKKEKKEAEPKAKATKKVAEKKVKAPRKTGGK